MAFNVGDRVKLKSGGPVMTVESVGKGMYDAEEKAFCAWFEKSDLKRDSFPLGTLEASPKPDPEAAKRKLAEMGEKLNERI